MTSQHIWAKLVRGWRKQRAVESELCLYTRNIRAPETAENRFSISFGHARCCRHCPVEHVLRRNQHGEMILRYMAWLSQFPQMLALFVKMSIRIRLIDLYSATIADPFPNDCTLAEEPQVWAKVTIGWAFCTWQRPKDLIIHGRSHRMSPNVS